MARDNNGIATRDDINSLGETKFTPTVPDGNPLNKCVPKSELMDDWRYEISGTYETNQLLKFQDVSLVFIPGPEPEPAMGDCIVDYTVPVLISNTGNPGSQYIAENGSGVLKLKFQYNIFVNSTGLRYPLDDTYYYPAPLTDVTLQDNSYFDAWIENGDTLCVSAKTNNVGQSEKSVQATLSVYSTGPYGICNDGFGYTITQIGIRKMYRSENPRVVYYDSNAVIRDGATNIQANGSGFARIVADIVELTGKTGYDASTYVPVTTHGDYFCKPQYAPGETNVNWFTIDGESNVVTAPYRGNTIGGEKSARFLGSYNLGGTYGICEGEVTIKQEANTYGRREETTGYRDVQPAQWSQWGDSALDHVWWDAGSNSAMLTWTGSSESCYSTAGTVGTYDSSMTTLVAQSFSGVREYRYYEGYTARIENGTYESSGTSSGYTQMDSVSIPSQYDSFMRLRSVSPVTEYGYPAEPTYWSEKQPRIIIDTNYADTKREFSLTLWKSSVYETNPTLKASVSFKQYEQRRTYSVNEIRSAGFCEGTYPYAALTTVEASRYGQDRYVHVTADCYSATYTIVDGVTSSTSPTMYTGRTSNTETLSAILFPLSPNGFAIRKWEQTMDFTPADNEMLYRDFGDIGDHTDRRHLAIRIYPQSANTGNYDKVSTWYVRFTNQQQEIAITHLKEQYLPSISITPVTDIKLRGYQATSGTVTINTNLTSWGVSSDPSTWLSITKGTNDATWNVTKSDRYHDKQPRTGTIRAYGTYEGTTYLSNEVSLYQPPPYLFEVTGCTPTMTPTGDTSNVISAGTLSVTSAQTSFAANIVSRYVNYSSGNYVLTTSQINENLINISGSFVTVSSINLYGSTPSDQYYVIIFNVDGNPSTASTREATVTINQASVPIYDTYGNQIKLYVTQDPHEIVLTPYDYLINVGSWYSMGGGQYCFYMRNTHSSRDILVSSFWCYKPNNGNPIYVVYPEAFVVPHGTTYYAERITFTTSDPYVFITERTGDHAFQVSWNS